VAKKTTVRWIETGDLIRELGLADSAELWAWRRVGVLGAVEVLRKPALVTILRPTALSHLLTSGSELG
jgi:hypothetical protein